VFSNGLLIALLLVVFPERLVLTASRKKASAPHINASVINRRLLFFELSGL
jgi:hypothetical protein